MAGLSGLFCRNSLFLGLLLLLGLFRPSTFAPCIGAAAEYFNHLCQIGQLPRFFFSFFAVPKTLTTFLLLSFQLLRGASLCDWEPSRRRRGRQELRSQMARSALWQKKAAWTESRQSLAVGLTPVLASKSFDIACSWALNRSGTSGRSREGC